MFSKCEKHLKHTSTRRNPKIVIWNSERIVLSHYFTIICIHKLATAILDTEK